MQEYRRLVNYFLMVIKYPLVLILLFSTPDMILAFNRYMNEYMVNKNALIEFFVGAFAFVFLYILIVRKFNSYFKTIVHEFTHMIFCVLCGNRVLGIYASFKSGGHIEYAYNGNWLISISPYFFPSFSVFLMFLMAFTGQRPEYSIALLGFITAFQVISNYVQIHPHQTDFKQAGYIFTCLFLLPANILMWGIILSFVDNGVVGIINFFRLSFMSVTDVIFKL